MILIIIIIIFIMFIVIIIFIVIIVIVSVFSHLCGVTPRFVSQGGTNSEDLALQNIQARLRMVFAYLCAQLFPWVRGKHYIIIPLSHYHT